MKGFLHEWTIYDDSQNAFEDIKVFTGSNKDIVDPFTNEVISTETSKTIRACIGDISEKQNSTDGAVATGNITCKLVTNENNLINWKFVKNGYVWLITAQTPSNTDENYYYEYICGRTTQATDEDFDESSLFVNYE